MSYLSSARNDLTGDDTHVSALDKASDKTSETTSSSSQSHRIKQKQASRTRELRLLYDVASVFAEAVRLDEGLHGFLRAVGEALDGNYAALWFMSPVGRSLHCQTAWHTPSQALSDFDASNRALTLVAGTGIPGIVWNSGTAIWLSDLSQVTDFSYSPFGLDAGLSCAYFCPVRAKGEIVAVAEVCWGEASQPDDAARQMIDSLLPQLGAFIKRTGDASEDGRDQLIDKLQAEEQIHSMALFPQENPNPVMRISNEGKVLYANEPSAALLSGWDGIVGHEAPALWRKLAAEVLQSNQREVLDLEHGDVVYTFTIVPIAAGNYASFYGVDISARLKAERAVNRMLIRTRELYETSRQIGLAQTATDVLRVLQSNSFFAHAIRISISTFDCPWKTDDAPPETMQIFAELNDSPGIPSTLGQRNPPDVAWLTQKRLRYGPVHVEDARKEVSLSRRWKKFLSSVGARGFTLFPLTAAGQWYGILSVYFDQVSQPRDEEMRHIQGLVDQAAIAIHNMRSFDAEAEARREAERASDLRLKFLAMISHELRTPLTPIKGLVTTLLADDVTWEPHEQRDFLNIIDQETDKLTEMIEQLLDLSRLEAGLPSVRPQPVSLEQIIVSAAPSLLDITKDHVMKLDVPDTLPLVLADERRVGQVIANLVSNAAKYSPSGTDITITAHLAGNEVQIDVADHGPGIPQSHQPYLFKPFYRGDDHKARQTKGAGLGLAICRGLVEAQGGRIWSNAGANPGAVISFTLPLAA